MELLCASVDDETKCRGRAADSNVPRTCHTQTKPLYDNTLAIVNPALVELAGIVSVCSSTTTVG